MSESAYQIHRVLTSPGERKELLILACEVDREGWRRACRSTATPKQQLARDIFGYLKSFSAFLPSRFGGWLSSASFLTNLARQFGWL